MANIYEQKSESLHLLLDRARSDDGATVVIPELQRPYVWKPDQVILLVDSLIHGWPFGTLLMWNVNHEELDGIPNRPFWRTIDRTEGNEGTTAIKKNPPASYHMVLDGQQRVQSLLLALGGDDWGFKLEDRIWVEELQDRRSRGRQPKFRHWSKASLCFDLDSFLERYEVMGGLLSIDFRDVLTWAITDPANGQSKWPKPKNYAEPLKVAYSPDHSQRLVRMSRLWQMSQPNPNLMEKDYRQIGKSLLEEHKIPNERIKDLLNPLGEFMTRLRYVKMSKVSYLELLPFDSVLWNRDTYNDAIVNIFTRLNSAGRTLTREEITFAWLKTNWDPALTENKSAAECFEELREKLKELGLNIEMDDVVNAVSFMWSVRFNEGKLLANSDLVKGPVIGPMAANLSETWSIIRDALLEVMNVVSERGFSFGPSGQFASVNALTIMWAWHSLSGHWLKSHPLSTPQEDELKKKRRDVLATTIDRWLLCSTWAGLWSGSSNSAVTSYAKDLAEDWNTIRNLADYNAVFETLEKRLRSLVSSKLEGDATEYVRTLAAEGRERVSVYRNVLWVWHRLDHDRWQKSKISLRSGNSKKISTDVDHTLPYAYWARRLADGHPSAYSDAEDALAWANALGNCALLEKSFNISKFDKTLKSFLEQVYEFKEKIVDLGDWAKALLIPDALLDPENSTNDQIALALEERDGLMRSEIVEFVQGKKERCDI